MYSSQGFGRCHVLRAIRRRAQRYPFVPVGVKRETSVFCKSGPIMLFYAPLATSMCVSKIVRLEVVGFDADAICR